MKNILKVIASIIATVVIVSGAILAPYWAGKGVVRLLRLPVPPGGEMGYWFAGLIVCMVAALFVGLVSFVHDLLWN